MQGDRGELGGPDGGYPRINKLFDGSWKRPLTGEGWARSVPIPHRPQAKPGNVVREGTGEIRPVGRANQGKPRCRQCDAVDDGSGEPSPVPRDAVGPTAVTSRTPLPPRPPRDALPQSLDGLPPFADSARAILAAGVEALGLDLDRPNMAALEDHARLLRAWTEHINLTGIRDPDSVAREHLLDSLAAAPLLEELGAGSVLDLGSGGGFPGVPLAIALPGAQVLLVELIAKKARFLGVLVEALALGDRVEVVHARAEALASSTKVDAVCVRAVADLGRLAELCAPLLAPGGRMIAWKRGDLTSEIAAATAALQRAGFERPDVIAVPVAGLEDHRLVVAARGGRRTRW